MKHLYKYKIFEDTEDNANNNGGDGQKNPKRSERLLNAAQKEWEDDSNIEKTNIEPCILFTDVVGSSKMWSDDAITMVKQLKEHHELIANLSEQNGGWVVKTIGDAFMIYFEPNKDSLLKALKCAKLIIKNEKRYKLRIGICRGPMQQETYRIQKVDLKDFYGNAVNVASRMESKIAQEPNFIAFSSIKPIDRNEMLKIKSEIGKINNIDLSNFDLRGASVEKAYRIKI
jgi:class 3 adenylate cyclase